jgi:hypothetical protein
VLAILIVLSEGPLHGYALLKRLSERADLGPRPGPTTLYRTLHELEDAGWAGSRKSVPIQRRMTTGAGRFDSRHEGDAYLGVGGNEGVENGG